MPLKTLPFDVAEHLSALEDQNDLIADAVQTGDPAFIRHTLNTVARARGMTQIARDAGVTREALYKALGPAGDPRMSTLLGVFNSLGVKLSVEPFSPRSPVSTHDRTLAVFFDTKAAAETAIVDIEALGIPKQHITRVAGNSTSAVGATATTPQHEGFLQSLKDLFMPEEDQYSYAEGLRRGGYLVSIRSDEANYNRILDILDRDGAVDMDERETTWRSEGWKGYQSGTASLATTGLATTDTTTRAAAVTAPSEPILATGTRTEGSDEVIPVYEESLQVGKREVSQGRLRVRSFVVETPVNEQVSLRTENVHVDRRPVERAVSATDAMFQDRVIEVEEFAEEAVVSKQARVVEEISLHKEARDRTETITDTVRHTEVKIEDGRGTVVGGSTTRSGIVESSNVGTVMAHMDVIASDGTKVGTVDHMDGVDTIKLAKNTSPDGEHHYVPMAWVDHVGQHVHLKRTTAEIEAAW